MQALDFLDISRIFYFCTGPGGCGGFKAEEAERAAGKESYSDQGESP